MDNHLGAVTTLRYTSSTAVLPGRRRRPGTRWRTPLPFPVQVVDRVEVVDRVSGGTLTTEFRYHHGYWDGAEREFRGFGLVEQLDTETRPARGEAFSPAAARPGPGSTRGRSATDGEPVGRAGPVRRPPGRATRRRSGTARR